MAEVEIGIEGADQLARALDEAPEVAALWMDDAMDEIMQAVMGQAQPYPPQPPRGRSQSFNTYVRGMGQMTRASFDEGGGYIGPREGPRGGQPRYTSEDLGQKWEYTVREIRGGYMGILGNTASYADVVQGTKQPAFHAETGWVTLTEAVVRAAKQIQMILTQYMDIITDAIKRGM